MNFLFYNCRTVWETSSVILHIHFLQFKSKKSYCSFTIASFILLHHVEKLKHAYYYY